MKKDILWITADYFMDTDIYVVKELLELYNIHWVIIRQGNNKIEYFDEITNLAKKYDINLEVIGKRGSSIKNIGRFKRILKKYKNKKLDMVYTCLSYPPFFLPLLLGTFDKNKIVLGIHNVHVPRGGTHYLMNKLYNRYSIKKFTRFQTFSKSQYDCLNKLICTKQKVYYAPFMLKDYGQATHIRDNDVITFMSFGNIRPYKRIDVLIEAAQAAYEITKKTFKVIIAGNCSEWEKYQNLIYIPELFDLRIARVDNEEVANLFEEADYFVVPYQDIAQSGSAIVAINYDKPIIASELPAFEDYIIDGETGFLFRPADVDELKNIIIRVLDEYASSYDSMKKNVINLKNEKFNTKKVISKYREFIDEVM